MAPGQAETWFFLEGAVNVPRSVISAKVKLALRWRSMFSENTKVLKARRGSPEKKSVSPRCARSVMVQLGDEALGRCLSAWEEYRHFQGTGEGRQRPRVRCRRGRARRGYRGLALERDEVSIGGHVWMKSTKGSR